MAEPPTLKERLTTCLRKQAEYEAKVKDLEKQIKALDDAGKDTTYLNSRLLAAEKGLVDENAKEISLNNLIAVESQALVIDKRLAAATLENEKNNRESYQLKTLLESIDPFHQEISIQRLSGTAFSDNYITFVELETNKKDVRKTCLITGRACSHQVLNKSGEYKPRGCVIADHILELNRSTFNMKTICRMHNKMNDERNCMFLLEGLERLFHNGRITLLPVNPITPRIYKLLILDQSVITLNLTCCSCLGSPLVSQFNNVTFEFPVLPYTRNLSFMAIMAHKNAVVKGWITIEDNPRPSPFGTPLINHSDYVDIDAATMQHLKLLMKDADIEVYRDELLKL